MRSKVALSAPESGLADSVVAALLEKIRDAAEPVRPMDVARAIMIECLVDQDDQKLAVAFQHKVHNVIRQQWQRGIVERVGAEDGWSDRWKVAGW